MILITRKKIILPILLCTIILSQKIFALPSHPIVFQAALGTSAVLYGDEEIKKIQDDYFTINSNRFILNADFSLQLILDKYVRFSAGSIIGFDWFKNNQNYLFLLDYDFYGGIRIYPNLLGFNFGIDYICGGYTAISSLTDNTKTVTSLGVWSNGFRLLTEYSFEDFEDFGISHAVGVYWQNMPKNNGYDNKLSVYAKLSWR